MKGHSSFPRYQQLVPYYQMQFSVISSNPLFGGFYPTGEQSTYHYHISQPLRSGRIWHKVNFLSRV